MKATNRVMNGVFAAAALSAATLASGPSRADWFGYKFPAQTTTIKVCDANGNEIGSLQANGGLHSRGDRTHPIEWFYKVEGKITGVIAPGDPRGTMLGTIVSSGKMSSVSITDLRRLAASCPGPLALN
jgi:hypothetical protein